MIHLNYSQKYRYILLYIHSLPTLTMCAKTWIIFFCEEKTDNIINENSAKREKCADSIIFSHSVRFIQLSCRPCISPRACLAHVEQMGFHLFGCENDGGCWRNRRMKAGGECEYEKIQNIIVRELLWIFSLKYYILSRLKFRTIWKRFFVFGKSKNIWIWN